MSEHLPSQNAESTATPDRLEQQRLAIEAMERVRKQLGGDSVRTSSGFEVGKGHYVSVGGRRVYVSEQAKE